ncbi:hypothetical protein BZA05DRAFT_25764 [Tricharina praecox]|uniref:uncharacterized protein n=1 Tax=Tricharina praecox TaxID=43433 RepID=UPI00221F30FB|nr:uncharacterized protein BZA05DRAFT_25764 [Tricharina praecox]KAI5853333.1 hypothetical protein BZA05DRAFT_25764 [Tricharina praecox]
MLLCSSSRSGGGWREVDTVGLGLGWLWLGSGGRVGVRCKGASVQSAECRVQVCKCVGSAVGWGRRWVGEDGGGWWVDGEPGLKFARVWRGPTYSDWLGQGRGTLTRLCTMLGGEVCDGGGWRYFSERRQNGTGEGMVGGDGGGRRRKRWEGDGGRGGLSGSGDPKG